MRSNLSQLHADENVYVGIDLHRKRWHITIRTNDTELFSASIPGTWEALERSLEPYRGHRSKRYTKLDTLVTGCTTTLSSMAQSASSPRRV